MLKPKKKLTRKEIRRDPFLETIFTAQQWVKDRRKILSQIGTGLVVLILAAILLNNHRQQTHSLTATQLGQAILSMQNGDQENAEYILQLLVDEHGNTPDGLRATYLLGKLFYEEGKPDDALPLLRTYLDSGDNEIMLCNAAVLAAHILVAQGDLTAASEILQSAREDMSIADNRYRLDLELARVLEESPTTMEEARRVVDPLVNGRDVPVVIRRQAEEIYGRSLS
ncbi:MAG: hypothetical protein D6762_01155 [Candidatus Neomarinimicrobiota bacterium]|nr:MAG: hypothetical protein D6762_01155 [Candidatus Neomarinimicrobiota bacterium]